MTRKEVLWGPQTGNIQLLYLIRVWKSPSLNLRLLYSAGGGNSAGRLVMVVTGPEGPKVSPSSSGQKLGEDRGEKGRTKRPCPFNQVPTVLAAFCYKFSVLLA